MDYSPYPEILNTLALFLWDYLRKSKSAGLLIQADGTDDSNVCLAVAGHMCDMVIRDLNSASQYNKQVIEEDLVSISKDKYFDSGKNLVEKIVFPVFYETNDSTF